MDLTIRQRILLGLAGLLIDLAKVPMEEEAQGEDWTQTPQRPKPPRALTELDLELPVDRTIERVDHIAQMRDRRSKHAGALLTRLRTKAGAREAILLRTILGPPRAHLSHSRERST